MNVAKEELSIPALQDHISDAENDLTWLRRWRDLTEITVGVAVGVSSLALPYTIQGLPPEVSAVMTGYVAAMFANAFHHAIEANRYRGLDDQVVSLRDVMNQRLLDHAAGSEGWAAFPNAHLRFLAKAIKGEKGLRLLKLMDPNSPSSLSRLHQAAAQEGVGYEAQYVSIGARETRGIVSRLVTNRLASCTIAGKAVYYSGHKVYDDFNPTFTRTALGTAILRPHYSNQVRTQGQTWMQRNITG